MVAPARKLKRKRPCSSQFKLLTLFELKESSSCRVSLRLMKRQVRESFWFCAQSGAAQTFVIYIKSDVTGGGFGQKGGTVCFLMLCKMFNVFLSLRWSLCQVCGCALRGESWTRTFVLRSNQVRPDLLIFVPVARACLANITLVFFWLCGRILFEKRSLRSSYPLFSVCLWFICCMLLLFWTQRLIY